ncbi:MAG: TonB-dependent receptor [Proteobacteria bacterium]|nr:TonB-dependent receptor [Pseudomonadota bacterium]
MITIARQGSENAAVRMKPLALGIRTALLTKRHASLVVTTLLASSVAFGQANEAPALEEIIVTAQKREQNLQEVPISIKVLDAQTLENLNIMRFDDYVRHMPNVSYQSAGPSQAQIYMRGVSDGGDGNFSGTNPSVALYLDEQPVTSIGRNLDVHIYDISRIETIAGPQGTLYGASSQAGVIRILTNKPNPEKFEAGYDVGINSTSGGAEGYSAEGFVNFPIGNNAAIRLVGWYVEEGGWIDEIAGSLALPFSGLTVSNSGNSDPNLNQVESDANTLTTSGLRAMLGIDLNDSWTVDASVMFQEQKSEGVFADQPSSAGQGNVLRFFNDDHVDEWVQFGLTINGDLGWADLTLAGSYLDRDVQYDIDYSQYAAISNYVEYYYTCYNYATYSVHGCVDPRIQYNQDSNYKRSTFEARLVSQGDGRLNWVGGLFYNKNEHDYFNQWHIPSIDAAVDPLIGSPVPTDRNVRGVTDLYFVTNQERESTETAIFGEVSFDFTDQLTGLVGARFFDTDDELTGFVGSTFSCFDPATGNRLGAATASGACGAGLTTDDSDSTFKVSVTYQFNDNFMGYVTYSEGFRPSGINREDSPIIPQIYKPDTIKNYELGWKATLAEGRLRFNGAVYFMDWDDMQLTRFDIDNLGSFLGLTSNTEGADITGFEADLDWQATDQLRLWLSASINEAELSGDFFVGTTDPTPAAPDGTDLPFTPDLKYSLGGRYSFEMGRFGSYVQAFYVHTDESWNDLFVSSRSLQADYGFLNASFGIQGEGWVLELYGDNLTDENAEIFKYTRAGDDRITANRPANFGVRFRQRFN